MAAFRVGVLMGGKSIEKEVSFNSGRTICDHLDTSRYDIIPIFQTHKGNLFILPWHFLHRGKINDFEHRLADEAQEIIWDDLKKLVDFVYIATHGRYAEDGTLQGFLEVLGIPYLGSGRLASALCMDKQKLKTILTAHGIDVPRGISITPEQINNFEQCKNNILQQLKSNNLNFPLVVKPNEEGSSLGITLVKKEEELHNALVHACTIHTEKQQRVLIEEKLEGMEFSSITITDYKTEKFLPLPPTEIVIEKDSHFFDYDQKYMPGRAEKFTPARCTPDVLKSIQDTCIKTAKALGITNIARIDGFVTKDQRIVIVDPNTLSGMAPSSFLFREAAEINMSHTDLINHLIETELQKTGDLKNIIKHEQEKEKKGMNNKKLRIAVLMGGASNEKEISLESGRNITYKLSPYKYDITPVFVSSNMELYKINQSLLVRNSTREIEAHLEQAQALHWHDLPQLFDFVFIGLHGGEGENGAVQGTLEMLGLPYNGSNVLTSALCMDKYKTNEYLRYEGFDVPQSLLIAKEDWQQNKKEIINKIKQTLPLPVIAKPYDDGCSVMVEKITTEKQLEQTIDILFKNNKTHALVEECIRGMELTVGVIGNEKAQALPPSQAVATQGILSIEEKFLPGAGQNLTPAPLSKAATQLVQKTMEKVYESLNCKGYARMDCFYQTAQQSPTGKERVVTLEINSLPGMTPATCIFHQAAEIGMKPMDFIDTIIELGLQAHKKTVQSKETVKVAFKEKNEKQLAGEK